MSSKNSPSCYKLPVILSLLGQGGKQNSGVLRDTPHRQGQVWHFYWIFTAKEAQATQMHLTSMNVPAAWKVNLWHPLVSDDRTCLLNPPNLLHFIQVRGKITKTHWTQTSVHHPWQLPKPEQFQPSQKVACALDNNSIKQNKFKTNTWRWNMWFFFSRVL